MLVWIALAVVYVVWGSTYLAIRVAVETLPPFLMAGTRFLVAGALLTAWALWRTRGTPRPGLAQWRAAFVVGGLLLLGGNGAVVWAEQRIPSGLAALLVATVPLWMAVIGRVGFGERLRRPAVVGLVLGFGGVALLVDPAGFDLVGTLAVLFAALSWASGSLWPRRAALPDDPLVATGLEMVAGGILLTVVGLAGGELGRLDLAAASTASLAAVAYLVVFGSLVAFTAYVWLLRNASTSLVGTYAYVNPVVAVLLGWAVLAEPVTPRMLAAGAVIVAAVALIVSARPSTGAASSPSTPRPTPRMLLPRRGAADGSGRAGAAPAVRSIGRSSR
jgi:drug/metabolite transporter (DMT)-like permease